MVRHKKTNLLKMAGPRFIAIKSTSAGRLVLILPVQRQKVKGIGPSPFEVGLGSREEEPTRTADRTAITPGLRHEVDTRLEQL